MASTLSASSSSSSTNGNTYAEFLQQAKRNFWMSNAHLTEEERNHAWFQVACQPTSASAAEQIPRSMPCPAPDMAQFSMSVSAPVMNRSDSAMNDPSTGAYTDYTLYSDSSMQRQPSLHSLPEVGCGGAIAEYSVDDYVSSCIHPHDASTIPFPQPSQPLQLTPTPQWSSSSDVSSPQTPSTALMTPVTQSSNMSRQGSYNPLLFDQASMLCVQSDSSCTMPILSEDGTFPYSFDVESKPISESAGVSPFLSFTGSSSEAFLSPCSASLSCSSSLPASVPALASSDITPFNNNNNNNNNNDQSCLAEDMRRSTSAAPGLGNSSEVSASSSTNSRQSQREREIIAQAASRKIAPKAIASLDETESASSNDQMTRIRSEDGSSKTVGVIAKTPYVRPQHPKIKCNFCNERPDGFRGTHELDRHIARAHASRRKGYICVDSSADQKFLANCKHCRNKKVYGAYYNAAAHLRRAHFHPRKRGRKGRSDEKRGGIGGGDHPPMEYLKQNWIKEVEVENKPTPQSPAHNSDNDMSEPINDNASFDLTSTAAIAVPAPATTASYTLDPTVAVAAQYPVSQQPVPMPLMNQVAVDANQFVDYSMTMHASEPMVFDNTAFFDPSLAPQTDMNSFQFDTYNMGS